jgi:hypothetical protein
MRLAIDSVRGAGQCVLVVTGWCESGEIVLLVKDEVRRGAVANQKRLDLVPIFGTAASSWGFVSLFVTAEPLILDNQTSLAIVVGDNVKRITMDQMPVYSSIGENRSLQLFTEAVNGSRGGAALEIGSRARSGNVYRGIFHEKITYCGVDIAEGPNVDVVADAHELPLEFSNRFSFAFSVSTFEHLIMPWKAALELNRVLTLGGLVYVQSHASWPLHEEPWDYFRFSKHAWTGLFNEHTGFEIVAADHCCKAFVTPEFMIGAPMRGLSAEPTYLLSACLARKVAPSKVTWDARPSEIANLAYSH